ncbi:GTP-binding protein [Bacillus licheniformis]|nr:GTP-binding protein [Bacillus licheniformis]
MDELSRTGKGEDLLRYKGILYIKGEEYRIVFQGLHMLFSGRPDRKWNETRKTKRTCFHRKGLGQRGTGAAI